MIKYSADDSEISRQILGCDYIYFLFTMSGKIVFVCMAELNLFYHALFDEMTEDMSEITLNGSVFSLSITCPEFVLAS